MDGHALALAAIPRARPSGRQRRTSVLAVVTIGILPRLGTPPRHAAAYWPPARFSAFLFLLSFSLFGCTGRKLFMFFLRTESRHGDKDDKRKQQAAVSDAARLPVPGRAQRTGARKQGKQCSGAGRARCGPTHLSLWRFITPQPVTASTLLRRSSPVILRGAASACPPSTSAGRKAPGRELSTREGTEQLLQRE